MSLTMHRFCSQLDKTMWKPTATIGRFSLFNFLSTLSMLYTVAVVVVVEHTFIYSKTLL